MTAEVERERTTAEVLQFRLQFMAVMMMAGRTEEADTAYQQALELVQELIDAGH